VQVTVENVQQLISLQLSQKKLNFKQDNFSPLFVQVQTSDLSNLKQEQPMFQISVANRTFAKNSEQIFNAKN